MGVGQIGVELTTSKQIGKDFLWSDEMRFKIINIRVKYKIRLYMYINAFLKFN